MFVRDKESVCDMIRPIDALAPKAYFRGSSENSDKPGEEIFREKIAFVNAVGTSAVIGAATTAVSRGAVSSWKAAFGLGALAGTMSMMFVLPMFMYKAGIRTSVPRKELDRFVSEKEVSKKAANTANTVTETRHSWIHNKMEGLAKNIIRKAS